MINYEDYDISPYKVVHIGEIADKSIVDILTNEDKSINVNITKQPIKKRGNCDEK